MAYETSSIADTASAIPSQPANIMREERVVDPYRSHARPTGVVATNVSRETIKPNIGQLPVNETKAAEESPATEESVLLSPQLAALARQQQKFRREQAEVKAQSEALAADKAELASLRALKQKLSAGDYSGIEEHVPYEAYTNYLIEKSETASPESVALKKLTEEVEGVKKTQKEAVEKQFEAAVEQRRQAARQLVDTNPEYAVIKKAKMEEAIVHHLLDTWEKDGKEISPEQAAKEVKLVLLQRANEWKALLEEEPTESAEVDQKKQLPPLKPAIKTLTNNMAVTGEIKRPVKALSNMSDSERYAEARRRAVENLKLQGR